MNFRKISIKRGFTAEIFKDVKLPKWNDTWKKEQKITLGESFPARVWNDKTWKKDQEVTRGVRILPHEVAEAEEEELTPEWGKVFSTDTGLDSVEGEDDEKNK